MSPLQLAVIVFGLFAGYWIVAKLLFPSKPDTNKPPSPPSALRETMEPAWFQILEVVPDADVPMIRDAYQRLMAEYHPDKVSGLGQELQDLAHRKSSAIQRAYAQGLATHGAAP